MVCNTAENSIPNNFHTHVVMLYSFLALLKTKQNRKPHNTSIHYRFNPETCKNSSLSKYWPAVNTSSETEVRKNSLDK